MGRQTPEDEMRAFLTGDARVSTMTRRAFRRVPSGPNCKLCRAEPVEVVALRITAEPVDPEPIGASGSGGSA